MLLPLAKRTMANPKARQLAMDMVKGTVRAIGARRRRRVRRGQRVIFNRIARRRYAQRRGATRATNRPYVARTLQTVPVAITQQTLTQSDPYEVSAKTEKAIDISSGATGNNTYVRIIPLCASSEIFPVLADKAASFTYFWFDRIQVSYSPSVGTDQKGIIALCWAKTYNEATSILDLSSLKSTGVVSTQDNSFKSLCLNGDSSMWNQTRGLQGCAVPADPADHPPNDTYDQGYLVILQTGDPTTNTALGTIDVSYDCKLLSPSATKRTPATVTAFAGTASSTNWSTNLIPAAPRYDREVYTLSGAAGSLTITAKDKFHYTVVVMANGAGALTTGAISSLVRCSVHKKVQYNGATSAYCVLFVKPTGSDSSFTLATTGTATGVDIYLSRASPRDFDRAVSGVF